MQAGYCDPLPAYATGKLQAFLMLFNSYIFVLGFLPLTLGIFALLAGRYAQASAWFLVLASLGFLCLVEPLVPRCPAACVDRLQLRRRPRPATQSLGWRTPRITGVRRHCRSRGPRLFQVCGLLYRPGRLPDADRHRPGRRRNPAAARHLVLHIHPDRVPRRRLCQQGAGIRLIELCAVRDLVSASHRRPDHASPRDDAAVRDGVSRQDRPAACR